MAYKRLEQDKCNHHPPVFLDEGIQLVRVFITWGQSTVTLTWGQSTVRQGIIPIML